MVYEMNAEVLSQEESTAILAASEQRDKIEPIPALLTWEIIKERLSDISIQLSGNDEAGKRLAKAVLYETAIHGVSTERINAAKAILADFQKGNESGAVGGTIRFGFSLEVIR